jgi:hypothetical protein
MQKIQFVLSGFAAHLASHFGRSFENHSYGYACSNDRPNCIASYTAKSGSFVQYAGVRPESCMLSKWVKGPPLKPGRERVTESCERVSNGGFEA